MMPAETCTSGCVSEYRSNKHYWARQAQAYMYRIKVQVCKPMQQEIAINKKLVVIVTLNYQCHPVQITIEELVHEYICTYSTHMHSHAHTNTCVRAHMLIHTYTYSLEFTSINARAKKYSHTRTHKQKIHAHDVHTQTHVQTHSHSYRAEHTHIIMYTKVYDYVLLCAIQNYTRVCMCLCASACLCICTHMCISVFMYVQMFYLTCRMHKNICSAHILLKVYSPFKSKRI